MQPHLRDLGGFSRADASAFFGSVDPLELVRQVVAASDEELLAVVREEHVRGAALHAILGRFGDFAVPARLREVDGLVRFELARRDQVFEALQARFHRGDVDVDVPGAPDVVLRTSPLRFLRLVCGELNAGLEYLSGRLAISGDAGLALGLGGAFRLAGTADVAVDPTALDPVDVAGAVAVVRSEHLRSVMASGFRGVVLEEIFRRMPEFLDEKRAARADLTVGFRLLGNPSGEVESWVVRVDRGTCTVTPGGDDIERDATVTCEGHDFLRLATGHLSPVVGVIKGVLKVKGDRARALQLSSVMKIPEAVA